MSEDSRGSERFPVVGRSHLTALSRKRLSRPVRLLLDGAFLLEDDSLLDFGCGKGEDVRLLASAGYRATGWDPAFAPDAPRAPAEVVNLGYVVNVIDNPEERTKALREAWDLATSLLVVSARLTAEAAGTNLVPYNDGFKTSRGTFQKFYTQSELKTWLEEVLAASAHPAAPGVFLVFKDSTRRESFLASRFRRGTVISEPLAEALLAEHGPVVEPLQRFLMARGRLPDAIELDNHTEVVSVFGTIARAFEVLRKRTGAELWEEVAAIRSWDVLVYLALDRFGGRPKFSELPRELQLDVRSFFGSYRKSCELADRLLFSAGERQSIDSTCGNAPLGKVTRDALYVHTSAVEDLAPVLRVYEGCARNFIGRVQGANVVKLHRRSPKISYLSYPDFDRKAHPALREALVVDLRALDVWHQSYEDSENPFILHRKETLVSGDYPERKKFEALTRREERLGVLDRSDIGRQKEWLGLLAREGLQLRGHRITRV